MPIPNILTSMPTSISVNTQYSLTAFDYVHAYAMLPFLVFHISLIVALCRAGHHDSTFREGFFVLFILLSVVDAWTVVQVRTCLETGRFRDQFDFHCTGEEGCSLYGRGQHFPAHGTALGNCHFRVVLSRFITRHVFPGFSSADRLASREGIDYL